MAVGADGRREFPSERALPVCFQFLLRIFQVAVSAADTRGMNPTPPKPPPQPNPQNRPEQLPDVKEEEAIRGFRVIKADTTELIFDTPGDYLVPQKLPRTPSVTAAEEEEEDAAAVAAGPADAEAVAGAVAAIAAAVGGGDGDGRALVGAGVGGGDNEAARAAAHRLTEAVFASVAGAK